MRAIIERVGLDRLIRPVRPLPVWLVPCVPAFLTEGFLVEMHEVPVPGEEEACGVDGAGVQYVRCLEVVEAGACSGGELGIYY